ncbi:MAG: MarR family transcriptional regulator [Lachnospiraceae bacterium]|nr:MarR family transcriptional regulator [Lachnospiraceae bacterium]
MLEETFNEVYSKFKLHFYQVVFEGDQSGKSTLTTVEAFCMETIHALGKPTVNEFASLLHISPQNAAYKVNNLVKKGYLVRAQSKEDKREFYLEVTRKYLDYCHRNYQYVKEVTNRVKTRFQGEDLEQVEHVLKVLSEELGI